MNLSMLLLNGYGLFVWPAFFLTFLSCFLLYTKTKQELERQQELYLSKFNVPVGELEIAKKEPISKKCCQAVQFYKLIKSIYII